MDFYTSVRRLGDKLLVRGYEHGKRKAKLVAYKPTLYVPTTSDTDFKTIYGQPVGALQFESMSAARAYMDKYDGVENFDFYGYTTYEYTYINDQWPGDVDYDIGLIRVVTIDIEVESEFGFPNPISVPEPVNAITLHCNGEITTFGCGDYTAEPGVAYIKCKDEFELLQKFIAKWQAIDPDIVTGWSCRWFDIPYLYNRIAKLFDVKSAAKLSPWRKIREDTTTIGNRDQTEYDIYGIDTLDYLDIYKKFTYKNHESYRLDAIAYEELKEKKVDYSEFATLQQLYKGDFQKFITYNIKDVKLVHKLDQKMDFMAMIIDMAYMCKVNYRDCFKQTRMWDALIHAHLMRKKQVIPTKKRALTSNRYEGAYVKDPKIGLHKWVVSFDLTSLYPHLIMAYNISPEKLIQGMKKDFTVDDIISGKTQNITDYSMTANGFFFNKDGPGFMPELMQKMFNDRVTVKAKMIEAEKQFVATKDEKYNQAKAAFKNKQQSLKICLNSCYGAIGSPHFRWYDIRLAEAITISGQLAIQWIASKINGYLNKAFETDGVDYIIASDTDSIYISLDKLFLNRNPEDNKEKTLALIDRIVNERLEPFIKGSYDNLAKVMNAYQQSMIMKREAICDRAIWTAKKRYVLNVLDNEGVRYKIPEIKAVGIEAVRSSTPDIVRKKIKTSIKIVMQKDEAALQHYISLWERRFKSLPFGDIAFPRTVSDIEKYADPNTIYKKACPVAVRGALLYNHHLNRLKLTHKYPLIKSGEKIKFCYLKMPNPFFENIIGAIDYLPDEFGLTPYLDYDTQFNKAYRDPFQTILSAIGWSTQKVTTLEDFFS